MSKARKNLTKEDVVKGLKRWQSWASIGYFMLWMSAVASIGVGGLIYGISISTQLQDRCEDDAVTCFDTSRHFMHLAVIGTLIVALWSMIMGLITQDYLYKWIKERYP